VTLPEDLTVEVVVDEAVVTDEEVDEQLRGLQERFGTLTGVDRPVAEGDFVQLDLRAEIDGQEVDSATGTSYQVGSATMIEGLDEAILGRSPGETVTFTTELAGGEHEGELAEVTVTIRAVKERHLPELNDEFAQLASEFDTLEELRADLRHRLEQARQREQAFQARDKILEALLAQFDIPVPAGLLAEEIRWRQDSMRDQLEQAGLSLEEWLESQGRSVEQWQAEIEEAARSSIKAQFVLDALARREQLSVTQEDLTGHIIDAAAHVGMSPDQFAQQAMETGQVPALVAEVLRGKALALVVEQARVTDTAGHPVDVAEVFGPGPAAAAAAAAAEAAEAAEDQAAAGDAQADGGTEAVEEGDVPQRTS
jgi:trigger factor